MDKIKNLVGKIFEASCLVLYIIGSGLLFAAVAIVIVAGFMYNSDPDQYFELIRKLEAMDPSVLIIGVVVIAVVGIVVSISQ